MYKKHRTLQGVVLKHNIFLQFSNPIKLLFVLPYAVFRADSENIHHFPVGWELFWKNRAYRLEKRVTRRSLLIGGFSQLFSQIWSL